MHLVGFFKWKLCVCSQCRSECYRLYHCFLAISSGLIPSYCIIKWYVILTKNFPIKEGTQIKRSCPSSRIGDLIIFDTISSGKMIDIFTLSQAASPSFMRCLKNCKLGEILTWFGMRKSAIISNQGSSKISTFEFMLTWKQVPCCNVGMHCRILPHTQETAFSVACTSSNFMPLR